MTYKIIKLEALGTKIVFITISEFSNLKEAKGAYKEMRRTTKHWNPNTYIVRKCKKTNELTFLQQLIVDIL